MIAGSKLSLEIIVKDNEKHWPDGYETVAVNGKVRPKDPPSVFPGVKPSQIPTPQPSLTTFEKTSPIKSRWNTIIPLFTL